MPATIPVRPQNVGPALAGYAGWGGSYWINEKSEVSSATAEIDLIAAMGFKRIAIPFELFEPPPEPPIPSPAAQTALDRLVIAVGYSLKKGLNIYLQIHCDGNHEVDCNTPWTSEAAYLAAVAAMATALQHAWAGPTTGPWRGSLTIVLGNELTGSPCKDWPTIMMLYTTLLPQCAKVIRSLLPGVKIFVPYMGDEQSGYLAAGMSAAGMTEQILLFGGKPSLTNTPIYDGVDLHYLFETINEAQQWIPGATVPSLLAMFREKYNNIPVACGEFSGMMPLGVSPDLVTQTVNLGFPVYYWQWWLPSGQLCLRGNTELLAAMGFGPAVATT